MKNHFLYLNTHRLSAYTWQNGSLSREEVFDNNDDGLAGFAHYLAPRTRDRFALLVNVAEEGHAHETIPFLREPTAAR